MMEMSTVQLASPVQVNVSTTKSPKKIVGGHGTSKVHSKRQGTKTTNNHPSYSHMVKEAIVALKGRKGSSRVAILKYISGRYQLGDNGKRIHSQLRLAIKKGITSGKFALAKGAGVNGSFKLGTKLEHKKKKESGKRKKKTSKQGKKNKVASASPKKPRMKKTTTSKKSSKKVKTSRPKPKKAVP